MLKEMLEGRELDLKRFYRDMKEDMIKHISKLQTSSFMANLQLKRIQKRLLKHFIRQFEKQLVMINGPKRKV